MSRGNKLLYFSLGGVTGAVAATAITLAIVGSTGDEAVVPVDGDGDAVAAAEVQAGEQASASSHANPSSDDPSPDSPASDQASPEAEGVPRPPPPGNLVLDQPQRAHLADPSEMPDGNYDTGFFHFQADAGQTVRFSAEAAQSSKLRPVLGLWNPSDAQQEWREIELVWPKEGKATLVYTFEEAGTFVVTVDDARHVPTEDAPTGTPIEPTEIVGGEAFSYRLSAEAVEP